MLIIIGLNRLITPGRNRHPTEEERRSGPTSDQRRNAVRKSPDMMGGLDGGFRKRPCRAPVRLQPDASPGAKCFLCKIWE